MQTNETYHKHNTSYNKLNTRNTHTYNIQQHTTTTTQTQQQQKQNKIHNITLKINKNKSTITQHRQPTHTKHISNN